MNRKSTSSSEGRYGGYRRVLVYVALMVVVYFLSFPPIHAWRSQGGSWAGGVVPSDVYRTVWAPAMALTKNLKIYFRYNEWCCSFHPDFNKERFARFREKHFD